MANNIFMVDGVRITCKQSLNGGYIVHVPDSGYTADFVEGNLRDAFDQGLFLAMDSGLVSIESYHLKTNKTHAKLESFKKNYESKTTLTDKGTFFVKRVFQMPN
jgi:hypothetical protein